VSAGTRRKPKEERAARRLLSAIRGAERGREDQLMIDIPGMPGLRDASRVTLAMSARARATGPQPSFTPNPAAVTREHRAVPIHPLDSYAPVDPWDGPMLADAIPAPEPEPEEIPVPPEYRVPTDSRPMLYTGPGWAGRRMTARVRDGEWDEIPLLVERGLGRNASEAATAFRHSHERIADAARRVCTEAGSPEQAGILMRRVNEMTTAARGGTGPQRRAFLTAPQARAS
jgi:hypothetical protein